MVLFGVYLAPALVARYRGHRQRLAIFVLTMLAGWTLLGWVLAMVWACTGDVDHAVSYVGRMDAERVEVEAAVDRLRNAKQNV